MGRRLARVASYLGLIALGLVAAILVLEVFFRAAGGLVPARPDAAAAADSNYFVILCVGDSHTYGLGKGYPATLGTLLAQRSPRYRVINLGVPGSNTAQLRRRFEGYLDRYQPQLVIHWAGLNNNWNRADSDLWSEAGVALPSLARRLLDGSRTLRFARVWWEQARLRRVLASSDTVVAPDLTFERGAQETFRRTFVGGEDVFEHRRVGMDLSEQEILRVTQLDLSRMIAVSRARGIPMVAIAYVFWTDAWGATNEGIRAAAKAAAVPVVETAEAVTRLGERYKDRESERPRFFDPSIHPSQALYDEIASLVLERLDREHFLPY